MVVWCPDCTAVDFQGCFDGGADTLGPFASREEAVKADEDATCDSIWNYGR